MVFFFLVSLPLICSPFMEGGFDLSLNLWQFSVDLLKNLNLMLGCVMRKIKMKIMLAYTLIRYGVKL